MGNASAKNRKAKQSRAPKGMDKEEKKHLSSKGKELFRKTISDEGEGKRTSKDEEDIVSKMEKVKLEEESPAKKTAKNSGYTIKLAKPVKRNVNTTKERTLVNETETDTKIAAPTNSAAYPSKKWTPEQDEALRLAVERNEGKNWRAIAEEVPGRTHVQCLQRWKKVLQPGLVKGHWSPEEDQLLMSLVTTPGQHMTSWVAIAGSIPGRTAKQCRERWSLNLNPDINREKWSAEEDALLLKLHAELGNKWAQISSHINGRTENAVKTRFKSLARAAQKEWTEEEDRMIIESKRNGVHWVSIANNLPNRSKNAARLRWKYLVGQHPELADGASVKDDQDSDYLPSPRPMQATPSGSSTTTHVSNSTEPYPSAYSSPNKESIPAPIMEESPQWKSSTQQQQRAYAVAPPSMDPYEQQQLQHVPDFAHQKSFFSGERLAYNDTDQMFHADSGESFAVDPIEYNYSTPPPHAYGEEGLHGQGGSGLIDNIELVFDSEDANGHGHYDSTVGNGSHYGYHQQSHQPTYHMPPHQHQGHSQEYYANTQQNFMYIEPNSKPAYIDKPRLQQRDSSFSRLLETGGSSNKLLKEYSSTFSKFSDSNYDILIDALGTAQNFPMRSDLAAV